MTAAGLSAVDLLAGFSAGSLSPVAVAHNLLNAADVAGRSYRHIVTMDRDAVLSAARESERRWRAHEARPLEGVPFALKGMVETDGDLVRRVIAHGAYLQCTVVPHGYGTPLHYDSAVQPLNPVDAARMPGGSSTGSGIALAAGHVPLAVGSDAAGSIRIPAICCEVSGYKPSRGALPRAGGIMLSPTLGEAGPMARTVADLCMLFSAMGGSRPTTPSSLAMYGVTLDDGLEPAAQRAFAAAGERVETSSAGLVRMELTGLEGSRAAGWDVLCYEAAEGMAPHLEAIRKAPTSFLKYADRGQAISDSTYARALVTGEAFAAEVDAALKHVDVLLTPCAPFALPNADDPQLASKTPRIGEMFLPFSLSGHPALVLPIRLGDGTVTSVQLVGRRGGDAELLGLAAQLEASLLH